ncbi:hypothetical protein O181_026323 [Austropuccinia psidii MF-1]|uniref:Hexosyltransferase n=1 Tax=Austropuccinia psidii MF-1 TaxID=1389203 RepID=A0A9Q3GZW9_9BASI|nr:hypothetical protein [Austropuccinia psidii MF-1]
MDRPQSSSSPTLTTPSSPPIPPYHRSSSSISSSNTNHHPVSFIQSINPISSSSSSPDLNDNITLSALQSSSTDDYRLINHHKPHLSDHPPPHRQPSCRHRSNSHVNPPSLSASFRNPSLPSSFALVRSSSSTLCRPIRFFLLLFKKNSDPFLPVSIPTRSYHSYWTSHNRLARTCFGLFILLTLASGYFMFTWLLDQPNSLQLEPIIDPKTFLLRPEGDPRLIKTIKSSSPSLIAFAQEQAARALKFASNQLASNKTDPLKKDQYQWYRPDPALINNAPTSRFHCQAHSATLLFIGIFTTPSAFEKRNLIRTLLSPELPSNGLIELKFISGQPENENWLELIKTEQSLHHDMVVLKGVKDNVDLGKTYEYFKWITQRERLRETTQTEHKSSHRPKQNFDGGIDQLIGLDGFEFLQEQDNQKALFGKPKFVLKSDDDTFLVIPNLIKSFKDLDCQQNVYWGTNRGSNKAFKDYFRGLGYGMSWPLVEWIGSSNMSLESQVGIEDARVGAWLTDLDPTKDPVIRINEDARMGDWNQLEINEETIALHWIKVTEWFPMVKLKVFKAWKAAKREYKWDYFLKSNTSR